MACCVVEVFRFLLTRIGRECDELIHRKDKFNCFISIEYLMEWHCTVSYYVVFRYLTVFHTLNGRCFLWMMALHFLMELPLSGKLLFDSYYEITSEWIEHDLRRRSLWWHHLMRDNSTKKQWRDRCSWVCAHFMRLLSCSQCNEDIPSSPPVIGHDKFKYGRESPIWAAVSPRVVVSP